MLRKGIFFVAKNREASFFWRWLFYQIRKKSYLRITNFKKADTLL